MNIVTVVLGALLFVSIFADTVPAANSDAPRVDLGGRSISLELVKQDDLSPATWPLGKVTLTTVTATTTKDTDAYSLLSGNGIVPDNEAFAVLYDLNPAIVDVKAIHPGSTVVVPKVSGGPQLQHKLQSGYLVLLSVDPDLRSDLNQSIEQLQGNVQSFAALPANRFAGNNGQTTKRQVSDLTNWYAQIRRSYLRRTGPPLRRTTLREISDEATRLNSLVTQAIGGSGQLDSADQEQIAAIFQDVESEMREYGETLGNEAPKAEPLLRVTVTIKGDNPNVIATLRVYYTFNGTFRDPPSNPPVTSYSFEKLGSGVSEVFPIKNYRMWAARDGDASHPLTPAALVHVVEGGSDPIGVDLSLNPSSAK